MDSRLNPFQDKMEKTLNNLEEEYAGILQEEPIHIFLTSFV